MSCPAPPRTPARAPVCPLCGGPNGCAVAESGAFATPCWCRDVVVAPERLAAVPAAHRGQACLCRRCAVADPSDAIDPPADAVDRRSPLG